MCLHVVFPIVVSLYLAITPTWRGLVPVSSSSPAERSCGAVAREEPARSPTIAP